VPTDHSWLQNMTAVKIPKIMASRINSESNTMETVGESEPAVTQTLQF